MSKYLDSQHRKRQLLETRLREVYYWTIYLKSTFDEYLARKREWEGEVNRLKVNRLVRAYLSAIEDILWRDLYQKHIIWYVRYKGELTHSDNIPDGEWHNVSMGAHVWEDDPSKIWADSIRDMAM